MLWDIYQDSKISANSANVSRAALDAQQSIHRLESKIDSLALTCQAMWEILRDRTDIDEEQLMAKMKEIDLRDGSADGKMGTGGKPCPSCGRMLSRRRTSCLYCGEDVGKEHVFQ